MKTNNEGFLLFTLAALVICCAIAMYLSLVSLPEMLVTMFQQERRGENVAVATPPPLQAETPQRASAEVQPLRTAPTIPVHPVNLCSIIDTGYLALINHQHAISAEPGASVLTSAWPTVPVSFIEGMYLHTTALQAVSDMLYTARDANVGPFFVSSGFRGGVAG